MHRPSKLEIRSSMRWRKDAWGWQIQNWITRELKIKMAWKLDSHPKENWEIDSRKPVGPENNYESLIKLAVPRDKRLTAYINRRLKSCCLPCAGALLYKWRFLIYSFCWLKTTPMGGCTPRECAQFLERLRPSFFKTKEKFWLFDIFLTFFYENIIIKEVIFWKIHDVCRKCHLSLLILYLCF